MPSGVSILDWVMATADVVADDRTYADDNEYTKFEVESVTIIVLSSALIDNPRIRVMVGNVAPHRCVDDDTVLIIVNGRLIIIECTQLYVVTE